MSIYNFLQWPTKPYITGPLSPFKFLLSPSPLASFHTSYPDLPVVHTYRPHSHLRAYAPALPLLGNGLPRYQLADSLTSYSRCSNPPPHWSLPRVFALLNTTTCRDSSHPLPTVCPLTPLLLLSLLHSTLSFCAYLLCLPLSFSPS